MLYIFFSFIFALLKAAWNGWFLLSFFRWWDLPTRMFFFDDGWKTLLLRVIILCLLASLNQSHVVFVAVNKLVPCSSCILRLVSSIGFLVNFTQRFRHHSLDFDFFECGRHEVSGAHPIYKDFTPVQFIGLRLESLLSFIDVLSNKSEAPILFILSLLLCHTILRKFGSKAPLERHRCHWFFVFLTSTPDT